MTLLRKIFPSFQTTTFVAVWHRTKFCTLQDGKLFLVEINGANIKQMDLKGTELLRFKQADFLG